MISALNAIFCELKVGWLIKYKNRNFYTLLKAVSGALVIVIVVGLQALPLYTARSGRICDNCHMNPFKTDKQNEWPNPELADRKCNLTCSTCHIDTAGGSLRRVAGRYYAASTLPVWGTEQRPYWDSQRSLTAYWKKLTQPAPKKNSSGKVSESKWIPDPPRNPALPDHYQTMTKPPFWTMADPTVFGNPIGAKALPRTYEPLYGVYGGLNADPFLVLSGNFRWLYYKTPDREIYFPMVNELGVAIHPVEKFTLTATGGVLGQATAFGAPSLPVKDRLFIRQATAMLHEFPYQSYIKAGVFTPAFGVRHEDHTIPTRRYFDMDYSRRNNAVYGVEAGLAPNYPFLSVSAFTNIGRNYEETNGWGTSVNLGWRDLLFGGGISFMYKNRDTSFGGDFTAASLDYYLNLGRLFFTLPITFLGEFSLGERQLNTGPRQIYANFIELNWLAFNGFNAKVNHHFYDPDIKVRNNESGHIGAGFDFTPFPFIRLTFEYRWAWIIPDTAFWRTGSFLNPSDLQFKDNILIVTHVYF
ncbi:MAG: hypothetical protein KDK41_06765 [Leptospiraceae bacterium]|nr:hypothetical protein [Leptospiraceae bacterium]